VDSKNLAIMLVSDEVDVVALIAVDKVGGAVNGIVQKGSEKGVQLTQDGLGGKVSLNTSSG
jgi:hypothetical protein